MTSPRAVPKPTSFGYGEDYQQIQAQKLRERDTNHWRRRILLARRLIEEFSLPRLRPKRPDDIVAVDVGCSIGTFAIELARAGYRSFGVDFDPAALRIAEQLAAEEGVTPTFVCRDIADWGGDYPEIDIALCFDIFEHLHDDELGSFLTAIRRQLSGAGSVVFHTLPTQYEHIFFGRLPVVVPLLPLAWLPRVPFERLVKAYSALVDTALILVSGKTFVERIEMSCHCNPLTRNRLEAILRRAGYEIVVIETGQLHPFRSWIGRWFSRHPITHRNIWGVAVPQGSGSLTDDVAPS
jgi:2-polyprenyl-3-methyl-5-hydroxy-6-metoxy-1,4-benzoquinol methylase